MSHSVRFYNSSESSRHLWLQQHCSHSDGDLKDKPKVNSMVSTPQMREERTRVSTSVRKLRSGTHVLSFLMVRYPIA